jgi:hypothetical protein
MRTIKRTEEDRQKEELARIAADIREKVWAGRPTNIPPPSPRARTLYLPEDFTGRDLRNFRKIERR